MVQLETNRRNKWTAPKGGVRNDNLKNRAKNKLCPTRKTTYSKTKV